LNGIPDGRPIINKQNQLTMNRFSLFLLCMFINAIAVAQTPFGIKNRVVRHKDPDKTMEYLLIKYQNGLPLKEYERNFISNVQQIRATYKMNMEDDSTQAGRFLTEQNYSVSNEHDAYRNGILKDAEDADLADKISTGIVISDDVNKLFPAITGNVVNYRLRLWSRIMQKGPYKGDTAEVYLPLSILSKVTGATGNNTGTVNDAASFLGAPLTLRFSPNLLDLQSKDKKSRLGIGMQHELRMLYVASTA